MIKKEIAEIKKQLTHKASSITRIAGCYVGGEKQKIAGFLALPEEESFKYFEFFSKALSGSLGKNLLNMEFPLETEEEGGTQAELLKLRDSGLKDEELLERFYDRVIDSYEYTGNYLILLVRAAYDVPGRTSDGLELEDSSDEVYEYILCCICPVELDKAALSYDPVAGVFSARDRDWIVEKPVNAFLFPAFNDRHSDIHSLLYYSKKPEEINEEFIEKVLGTVKPMTAGTQKENFRTMLESSLEEECSYDTVRLIQERVNELVEEKKEEPGPVVFEKKEVMDILSDSGVSEERLELFEKEYDETIGKGVTLQASNIVDTSKLKVKTSGVEIKCSPLQADLLETRIIDGRRCIVIPLDDGVTVNGINVIPGKIKSEESE